MLVIGERRLWHLSISTMARCDGCDTKLDPDNDGYFCPTCQDEFEEAERGAACAPTDLDCAPDTLTFTSDLDREMGSAFAGGCDSCGGVPGSGVSCPECEDNYEACPGCGSLPGDGITPDCDDPLGCGHNKKMMHAAVESTQHYIKHESAKFDGNAYMDETIRLEEARKRQNNAPVERDSVGHKRQLRTQDSPNNRIRFGR